MISGHGGIYVSIAKTSFVASYEMANPTGRDSLKSRDRKDFILYIDMYIHINTYFYNYIYIYICKIIYKSRINLFKIQLISCS
jgi:hypothetical protein